MNIERLVFENDLARWMAHRYRCLAQTTHHDTFEHCLTAKLLTYALGRGLERYDKRTVSAIVSRLPEHEYRFSGLVLEIVKSLPFQSRRNVSTP